MKKLLVLLLLYSPFCISAKLELLPKGRPFRLTFADPREIRMALLFESNNRIQALVGNYFSVLSLNGENNVTHFGIEGAGFFSLRQAQSRFPLEHTDGLLGVYIEGEASRWQWQLRYTHISAHLADGISTAPIAYSREYISARVGFLHKSLHVYGGPQLIAHSIPKVEPWAFQLGASYFVPVHLGKLVPFGATDLKWKAESEVNPSWALQLGLAINNPPESYHSFRFFYSYYTGSDSRGQFFTRSYTAHSLGIEMQI